MCGICGIISRHPIPVGSIEPLQRMQAALQHRGPDGAGKFIAPQVQIAVRRLSIIDIQGGSQPLYNEDSTLVLIANGEIYNYIELREQLEKSGHCFNTHSDCETILHLYEEYGLHCVDHLRGMFAFALYDTVQKRVLLARDRVGEKPLYLYSNGQVLIFASEMKALLRSGLVPFELDPAAINLYFHYQYVPEPYTPLKMIRKLPAGSVCTVDLSDWQIKETPYWNMVDAPRLEGDPVELIREQLEEVSRILIRSDVPVGVALSGGVDSGAIAALAARYYPGTIHAFSVGYTGRPPYDERRDAQTLAEYLKIPFHEVELSTPEIVDFFPELIFAKDDPIADISGHGYYAVMKLARDHGVPVIMQGHGGDELFWGYEWVREAVSQSISKKKLLRNNGISLLSYFKEFGPKDAWGYYTLHKTRPDKVVFYDLARDFQNARKEVASHYTHSFNDMLLNRDSDPFGLFTSLQESDDIDNTITKLIFQTYLLENGIAQGDRLSMASSVELRLPYVDYRLVETVVGLRKSYDDRKLQPKAWLRESLAGRLPDWLINRPKRGFEPPVLEWHNALFKAYGNLLHDGYLVHHGILKKKSALEFAHGPFPPNTVCPLSFKALVLELWCRKFSCLVGED